MAPLSGVPFPYDAANMPTFPRALNGTWIQGAFNNYSNEGNATWVQNALDIAIDFSESRGVPVFCGEFGVYIPNSDNETRVNWYDVVASYLTEHNVSWTIWDYRGGFGVYEEGGNDLFNHNLNIPLLEVLGFNTPEQTEFEVRADSTGFDVYSDFTEQGIRGANNVNSGTLELYNTEYVLDGDYSIYWSGSSQYEHIGFDFAPNKDLSRLVSEGYELVMHTLGAEPFSFDIRFIDTKTSAEGDRPWRMNVRIETTDLFWDGEWEEIRIPLSSFTEMGSWDENQWFDPQGDFDWSAVDVFQLVEESNTMGDAEIWIDAIGIVESGGNTVSNEIIESPSNFSLNQNYPNPFNPTTTISFQLSEVSNTTLTIFDTTGRQISEIVNSKLSPGVYSYSFDASGLASGVYFYKLSTNRGTEVKKMILLK
jgi:endoglucanase